MEKKKKKIINIDLIGENDVKIKCDNNELVIYSETKEIKASEVLELINYNEGDIFVLGDINDELEKNELVKCIYEIFQEIVNKINNIDKDVEVQGVYDPNNDLAF